MPGVQKRLEQVVKGKPRKIFLLIGINDVSHGHSVDKLAERYESLVNEIRLRSPETRLYLQSIMPINNDYGMWQFLADKNGKLKNKYTNDGLHLTGPGYKAWTNGIRSYLDE